MYRACSTWQYEVVGHLVEQRLNGQRLGYMTGDAYEALALGAGERAGGDEGRCWRVLKSHEGHSSFARGLRSGRALAVYVYRDLRDVIDSLMYKRNATFDELLRQGMIHQIMANDRFWRAQPRVLVQRYEVLIDDPVTAVVQLARHLGLGVTRREAMQIADEFSLESNQTRIEALRRRLEEAGIDLDRSAGLQVCDPVTLLHWNHLRPAGSACWDARATPRERAILERVCGTWLRAHGYSLKVGRDDEPVGLWDKLAIHIQGQRDAAHGRVALLLRTAAARLPLAASLVRMLLGMAGSSAEDVVAWPVIESRETADIACSIERFGEGGTAQTLALSPCPGS
jgi:Sulfotransferase domain